MKFLKHQILLSDILMEDGFCAGTSENFLRGERVIVLKTKRDRCLVQGEKSGKQYFGWTYKDDLSKEPTI